MNHTLHKQNTIRVQGDLEGFRKEADELILRIWDEVENHFRELLPYERMCRCKEYGVIYYYRKGEKELSPRTDLELKRQREMELQLW